MSAQRVSRPFDFTRAMRVLCEDVCTELETFHHINMDQVAVTFAQARSRVLHGIQAKLTPLRFEGGKLRERRSGRLWTIRRMYDGRHEVLYILTFYLPRFLDQTFEEKMITVLHELYHISQDFNGDIRRFEGRYHVHSHSQKEYDRQMDVLAKDYLRMTSRKHLHEFLRYNFAQLQKQFGAIVGLQLPVPKLIPVNESKSA